MNSSERHNDIDRQRGNERNDGEIREIIGERIRI